MQTKGKAVKADCRHFKGDQPCHFHKTQGVECGSCPYFDLPGARILLIKLGAMGDVLRTTSILPALHKKYARPHITWITLEESLTLLDGNPWVDSLVPAGSAGMARLFTETFDAVLNPEATKESSALASLAKAKEKKGFGLSSKGFVFPFHEEAEEIFHLGLFDDLKKANQKTYEQLICELLGLTYERVPPILHLTPDEIQFTETFLAKAGIDSQKPVVGLNSGGGSRWPLKRWTTRGFVALSEKLSERIGAQVLLFGGPMEEKINEEILAGVRGTIVNTGCFRSVREFAALLRLCDVVVTGDSLGLHIALSLGRRVVVLFGPTSATEIDLYDMGQKVTPEMDCLSCYRQVCEKSPNCMENISAEAVYNAVVEEISIRANC